MIYNIELDASQEKILYVTSNQIYERRNKKVYAHYVPSRGGIILNDKSDGMELSIYSIIAAHIKEKKFDYGTTTTLHCIYVLPIIDNSYYYKEYSEPPTIGELSYMTRINNIFKVYTKTDLIAYIETLKNMVYLICMSDIEEVFVDPEWKELDVTVRMLSLRTLLARYRPSYNNIKILMHVFKMDEYIFDDYSYKRTDVTFEPTLRCYQKLFEVIHENAQILSKKYSIPYCVVLRGDALQYIALSSFTYLITHFECPYNIPSKCKNLEISVSICMAYDIIEWIMHIKSYDEYEARIYISKSMNIVEYGTYGIIIDGCVITSEQKSFDDTELSIVYGTGKGYIKHTGSRSGCVILRSDKTFCAFGEFTDDLYSWSDSIRYLYEKMYEYIFDRSMDGAEVGYYYIKRKKNKNIPYFTRQGYKGSICCTCRYNYKGDYVGFL